MSVHVFGIRHHGPGSSRSLLAALRALAPDLVLVEGPVEGDDQIRWLADEALRPPVALLVYRPDKPESSTFYPFSAFSPEYNALRYALTAGIPARFMDLPKSVWLALPDEDEEESEVEEDPLQTIARIAGEEDFERWWDRLVENRGEADVFGAIQEAMSSLRNDGARKMRRTDQLREAAMRQQIRAAEKEGFGRIAVVCGAWHGPALTAEVKVKDDAALLKGLDKVKVQTTWVPWTHGRLTSASGYGAGVTSPGWYEHLWLTKGQTTERWMSKAAQLLRAEDMDASPAQVVDAVRLAESLAAFRGRPQPGLPEMNDAIEAALLFGNLLPMRVIERKLMVGETMGEVPSEATAAPIQRDLEALQKRLRLKAEPVPRELELDLRKEGDRDRSQLLHRLQILSVPWGTLTPVSGRRGTFHEVWKLEWKPEFAIELISAAVWGNTVESAAAGFARNKVETSTSLRDLCALIEPVLKANLPNAAPVLLERVRAIAALAPDIGDLMDAIPPLARVTRYGDARETDRNMTKQAIGELSARVFVGLPVACGSLNDDAATEMTKRIRAFQFAVAPLEDAALQDGWREAIRRVADLPGVHGKVGGRCCRLLYDGGTLSEAEISAWASRALSPGTDAMAGAAWIEGFLEESGAVLLANDALWGAVDAWVQALPGETFKQMLPLLRRTFATFHASERRQLGERVKGGARATHAAREIDEERAAKARALIAKILGLADGD